MNELPEQDETKNDQAASGQVDPLVMRLTIFVRLRLCWEILTTRSGHAHHSQEKQLSTFQRGYAAGLNDARLGA
jgi:hypothetical protein